MGSKRIQAMILLVARPTNCTASDVLTAPPLSYPVCLHAPRVDVRQPPYLAACLLGSWRLRRAAPSPWHQAVSDTSSVGVKIPTKLHV